MSDQKPGRDPRADRLRAALRENLKRRKAQAKGKAREQAVERAAEHDPTQIAGQNSTADADTGEPGRDSGKTPNSAGFAPDKSTG